jgi:hypothetical protein
VTIVHPRGQAQVPVVPLVTKCTLFKNTPALLSAAYRIESSIPAEVFRVFVSALKGSAMKITDANWAPLSLLSEELGFDLLSAYLSAFRPSLHVQNREARSWLASLEERVLTADIETVALQAELVRSEANLARLSSDVESLPTALETAENCTSTKAEELELGDSGLESESARLSSALESHCAVLAVVSTIHNTPKLPKSDEEDEDSNCVRRTEINSSIDAPGSPDRLCTDNDEKLAGLPRAIRIGM